MRGRGGTAAEAPTLPEGRGGTQTAPKKGSTFLTAPGVASLVTAARAAHAAGSRHKASKHSDSGGLFLFIDQQARASWRVKFRVRNAEGALVERLSSLGPVAGFSTAANAITLAQAREQLKVLKGDLAAGNDPVQQAKVREREKASDNAATFGALTTEWLAKQKKQWSDIHYLKSSQALERDILPMLRDMPVSSIKPAHINKALHAIADRGAPETAHRLRQHVGGVMKTAIARGIISIDPSITAALDLDQKYKRGKRPAFVTFKQLGEVLRGIDAARISPAARIASDLLNATLVRIGELTGARWKEFDLDAEQPRWAIPRARMKDKNKDHDHGIPLPVELAERLKKWRLYCDGSPFVFPGATAKGTISPATLEKLYSRTLKLGGKHCPHGWRASFSTLAREAGHNGEAVEIQLDHAHGGDVQLAYDRGVRWDQRLVVMTWWWAALEQAKVGAKVLPFNAAQASA